MTKMESSVSLLKRIIAEELQRTQEDDEKKARMEFVDMEHEIIRTRLQAMDELKKMEEVRQLLQKRMAEVSLRQKTEIATLRQRYLEEEERAGRLEQEEESMMSSLATDSGMPSLPVDSAVSLSSEPAALTPEPGDMSSPVSASDTSPQTSMSSSSSLAAAARRRAEALRRATEAMEAAAERTTSLTFPRVEALLSWAEVGKGKGGGKGRAKGSRKTPTAAAAAAADDVVPAPSDAAAASVAFVGPDAAVAASTHADAAASPSAAAAECSARKDAMEKPNLPAIENPDPIVSNTENPEEKSFHAKNPESNDSLSKNHSMITVQVTENSCLISAENSANENLIKIVKENLPISTATSFEPPVPQSATDSAGTLGEATFTEPREMSIAATTTGASPSRRRGRGRRRRH